MRFAGHKQHTQFVAFFFSSRRRHTRFSRDWSSDVCSSDLGPDIVAGVLATGLTLDRRVRLFIDVGTNSEIVLGSSARALACAAPAGPAFEAAQIRCGMRAAEGAIEGVKIVDGEIDLTVIGDTEPQGLCGSGLVDAVAELVGAGVLDNSGKFVPVDGPLAERMGKV